MTFLDQGAAGLLRESLTVAGRLTLQEEQIGELTSVPGEAFAICVEDWGLGPATMSLHLPTVPRWQAWRMRHSLRAPLPILTVRFLKVELNASFLQFAPQSGPKASWHDWHRGIKEQTERKQPERAGYVLVAHARGSKRPRSALELSSFG